MPVVLCYLEGLTHEQAAQRLGWPLGTVESRLARARDRLRQRLDRRGVMPSAALLGARSFSESAATAVSQAWIEQTARSAAQFAEGKAAATVASANVALLTRGTLKTMALTQLKLVIAYALAAGARATGVIAVLRAVSIATPESQRFVALQPFSPSIEQPKHAAAPWCPRRSRSAAGCLTRPGNRRTDPACGSRSRVLTGSGQLAYPMSEPPRARMGASISPFQTPTRRSAGALRMTSGWPGGFGDVQVLASAEGLGPAWTGLAEIKGEIELRLTPDDIPIEGRLLTLEGRPIAGITVRTLQVEDASGGQTVFGAPSGFFQSATTGADGRFRLAGIGRGRRAMLGFAGQGITRGEVQAVTGSFPADHPTHFRGIAQVAAKFEHLCKPGKSITGVVRDIETGAPLAGIRVRKRIGDYGQDITDQQGRYRLDGLSKEPTRTLSASANEGEQPYIASDRTLDDSSGYEPLTVDFELVRGVVVRGRLIDRATGRPVQAWVGYAAMRDNPHWARVPGFQSTLGNSYRPTRYVPSMADGSFRLVVLPGKGFLVAFIQYQSDRYLPAGVPNKRMPGAPADALDAHYDTVPFELFTSNFPAVKAIDIAPGTESINCDLTFDSGVTRTGTVHDPQGRPLSGTTMVGETRTNFYRFTPMDGPNFTVYGLFPDPKLYRTVVFRHAEKGLGKTLRIDGSDPGPIKVQLEPMASLAGRLLDESGKPSKGAELRLLRIVDEPLVVRQRRIHTAVASDNRQGRTVPHRRNRAWHCLLAPDIRGPVLQPRLLDSQGRRGQGSRRHHPQTRELIPVSAPMHTRLRSQSARSPWTPYRPSEIAPWNLRRVVHLHRCAGFAATWNELRHPRRGLP